MKFAVQNVQCFPKMPQKDVEHDVKATGLWAGVICWQEIEVERYAQAIRELPYHNTYFGPTGCGSPISWDTRHWRKLDKGWEVLHRSLPGVCGTRHLVWVLLENLETGKVVLVFNFHFIPGAFPPSVNNNQAERRKVWFEGQDVLINFLTERVQQGYTIIGGGDSNRKHVPIVGNRICGRKISYHTAPDAIDKIITINGPSSRWNTRDTYDLKPRRSDHIGRGYSGTLRHGR